MELTNHQKAQAFINQYLMEGYTLISSYGPDEIVPSFFRAYLLDQNNTHVVVLRSIYFNSTDNEEMDYIFIPVSDIENLHAVIQQKKEAVQK